MGHLVTCSFAYVILEIRCESDVDITGYSSSPPSSSDTTLLCEP